MKKKNAALFELPPKCPALADKISGIFGWRHTYQVHQRQKGIPHGNQYICKSYSLNLPRKGGVSVDGCGRQLSEMTVFATLPSGIVRSSSSDRRQIYPKSDPPTFERVSNPDSWVVVHHLQSQSGILDPEDYIRDVADDREEIIASYEDAAGPDPGVQQGGGDGASGSSVGTGSPDIFQVGGGSGEPIIAVEGSGVTGVGDGVERGGRLAVGNSNVGGTNGIVGAEKHVVNVTDASQSNCAGSVGLTVTSSSSGTHISTINCSSGVSSSACGGAGSCIEVSANETSLLGLGLQVRRGSEPSLHQINVTDQRSPLYNLNSNGHDQETTKRWSAAPVCRSDDASSHLSATGGSYLVSPEWNVPEEDSSNSSPPPPQPSFNRSGRLSMQFLGTEATASGYRWIEAAEKAANNNYQHHQLQSSPSYHYQQTQQHYHHQHQQNYSHPALDNCNGGSSVNNCFSSKSLPRESTRKEPLGQAKASVYDSMREKESEMLLVVNEAGGPLGLTAIPDTERGGLLVQSVEPGSRAERGRLRRGDRILEINSTKLVGLPEGSVQEHLRKSLASTELRLRVVRNKIGQREGSDRSGGGEIGSFGTFGRLVTGSSGSRYQRRMNNSSEREAAKSQMIDTTDEPVATKVATVSPNRKTPGSGQSTATVSLLQAANTRKLGKRIEITLTKGDHGLGFSVTTRDNPAGGHCPIYIKNILPKGAAVEDGRLKSGDRLLEVEGVPMTGKSQTEVVSILRGIPHGATLTFVVSRQQELAVDCKEREIGFSIETEPKNSPPKPPAPVMPKSSLKQHSTSVARVGEVNGAGRGSNNSVSNSFDATAERSTRGSNYRSLPKLGAGASAASSTASHKTPTVQKRPLASILKSASTNQVAELLQQQQESLLGDIGENGNGSGKGNMTVCANTNGYFGNGSLVGAAWKNREILTLHIPVHDTEKAGLGVSVKGKTGSSGSGSVGNSSNSNSSTTNGNNRTDGDLGIFVKSVLHGGAASRDGRLKMNDQLMSVNGVSLLGQSNAEAMDTLRRAMLQSGGSYPGKIILTVARRIGRPVSTGELLDAMEFRTMVSNNEQLESGNGGTTVIYLSQDNQHQPQKNSSDEKQQAKRYSNPVLDRLTGGVGSGDGVGVDSTNQSLMQKQNYQPLHLGSLNSVNGSHNTPYNHSSLNQRVLLHRGAGAGALRNESYYMATNDHWSTTSSATSLNGSNAAVLIEEDPEPNSPTFQLMIGRANVEGGGKTPAGDGSTSTPIGSSAGTKGDTTYASQLSLETNPPTADAFSRDAIGRRSMSEKHHAAMDARETGTYQRNKKLREERERDSQLLLIGSGTGGSGSMESISHVARMNGLKYSGAVGGTVGLNSIVTTVTSAAHQQQQHQALYAEAQDQLSDLGPSLGMKKSSSLESLQTMVQEIQMADEPRGPNALRTPRGRGREEILRAVVEQPPETQAKKHWLLEDASMAISTVGVEHPDGGFAVTRNSPFQSSLNDGKGVKLRTKKGGGLLRGIGHMFRFGKHRKDGIMPSSATNDVIVVDYTGSTPSSASTAWNGAGKSGCAGSNNIPINVADVGSSGGSKGIGGANVGNNGSNNGTDTGISSTAPVAVTSRYIVYEPNSVERSASSGIMYGHQPPHYQPPPPPPVGTTTSIHHTDVFNHRYSHYVNYEELQQQISRRHHHYHSQRSARNNPLFDDQQQLQSLHHHNVANAPQNQSLPQQKYKNTRPVSSYYDGLGGGYETIPYNGSLAISKGSNNNSCSSHRKGGSSISNNAALTVSSTSNGSKQQEGTTSNNNHRQHHHQQQHHTSDWRSGASVASTTTTAPGGTGGGSMRNLRGPFVTQVQIQNQISYE
ncbi:uncharacterized protein LOC128271719 [Anopheles cruzii]|uniref:uncharacterized protein LOC128271719 n=1 Tax=Anopheles cruzii TaxID=68878 RepID=UPI0022EC2D67|nr:uncharacterized protein LOC128271719 [Anopheles cruzii]